MSRKQKIKEEPPDSGVMTKEDGESLTLRVAEAEEPTESREGSLFDGLDLPETSPIVPISRPDDGIPPLDIDLTADEKKEFVALLNKEMPLADRAHQLAVLARMKGTKTAAVGLRAVIEINSLCGLRENKATEDAPMFVLPSDSRVAVLIQKVEK